MVPKSHQILPCYIIYLKKKGDSIMNSSVQTNVSSTSSPNSALRTKGKQLPTTVLLGNLKTVPSSNQPGINDTNKSKVSVPISSSQTQQTKLNITPLCSKSFMKSDEKLIPIDPHFDQIEIDLKKAVWNAVRSPNLHLPPYNRILALCIQVSRLECSAFSGVQYYTNFFIFSYQNSMFYYHFI